MPEDADDNEIANDQFAGIVNSNDWEPEPSVQFKIVENVTMVGIILGVMCFVAAAVGGVIWVWKQIL